MLEIPKKLTWKVHLESHYCSAGSHSDITTIRTYSDNPLPNPGYPTSHKQGHQREGPEGEPTTRHAQHMRHRSPANITDNVAFQARVPCIIQCKSAATILRWCFLTW